MHVKKRLPLIFILVIIYSLPLFAGEYYYHLHDHLGSVRVVVDKDANVIESYDYYPFGAERRSMINANQSAHLRFTGKELDNDLDLGLYYFGARYYDAEVGRFISVDPLADKYPGLTPYHYAANNPLKFVDPNGQETYLIIYGQPGTHTNGTNEQRHHVGRRFKQAAQTYERQIKSSENYNFVTDQVHVFNAGTVDEFKNIVTDDYESGAIKELSTFSHGYETGINLGGAEAGDWEMKNVEIDFFEENKNSINLTKDAKIRFNGCNTGKDVKIGNKTFNFAKDVAKTMGVPTSGFRSSSHFKVDGESVFMVPDIKGKGLE